MNLLPETGEFYSQKLHQKVCYTQRVEGMPLVKTAGNWFYNYEADSFITTYKLTRKIANETIIDNENSAGYRKSL
jgi:hypothetical protein